MKTLAALHAGLRRVETWFCTVLFLAMVAVILLQIADVELSRLIHGYNSHAWTQDLALLMFVWVVFVGGALGLDARAHFGIDLFVGLVPAGARKAFAALAYVVVATVSVVFVIAGMALARDGLSETFSTLTLGSWPVPKTAAYLAIPVGGLLMLRYTLVNFWTDMTAPHPVQPEVRP